MNQRRLYKKPPIEEALCEFHFQPSQDWDLTIPGKLHVKLGSQYSGKPQEQKVVDVAVKAQEGQAPQLRYGEGLAKVQLITENGRRMVAIGRDVLSVHMLRPYHDPQCPDHSGWDEFQLRIKEALEAYWEVVQPKGVLRVGVRYVNKVVIPSTAVEVEKYLKCALPVVTGLPARLNSFVSRVEYAYEDGVCLVLSQGSINAPPNHVGFLLDLDVIWKTEESVALNDAFSRAGDLRDRERAAFEAVITDNARELFDAG